MAVGNLAGLASAARMLAGDVGEFEAVPSEQACAVEHVSHCLNRASMSKTAPPTPPILQGEIAVHALQTMNGAYTFKSVNEAFPHIKSYDTGMLCQPWTFGDHPLHIANNTDYTVTPENGKTVLARRCTPISSVDREIAAYHKVAG